MNGRIKYDDSPEGRIAGMAKALLDKFEETYIHSGVGPRVPDYADFRDVLRPFVQRELLKARINEARKTQSQVITDRVRELSIDLAVIEAQIPKEFL